MPYLSWCTFFWFMAILLSNVMKMGETSRKEKNLLTVSFLPGQLFCYSVSCLASAVFAHAVRLLDYKEGRDMRLFLFQRKASHVHLRRFFFGASAIVFCIKADSVCNYLVWDVEECLKVSCGSSTNNPITFSP